MLKVSILKLTIYGTISIDIDTIYRWHWSIDPSLPSRTRPIGYVSSRRQSSAAVCEPQLIRPINDSELRDHRNRNERSSDFDMINSVISKSSILVFIVKCQASLKCRRKLQRIKAKCRQTARWCDQAIVFGQSSSSGLILAHQVSLADWSVPEIEYYRIWSRTLPMTGNPAALESRIRYSSIHIK